MSLNNIAFIIFFSSLFLLSSCGAKQTRFYRSSHHTEVVAEAPKPFTQAPPMLPVRRSRTRALQEKKTVKAPTKSIKDMTFQEAAAAKAYHTYMKNTDMVIRCAQRMLAVGNNQEEMRNLRLELAETFLEKQNYTEAERYALDYQKHYPGSTDARYAGYLAIKANFLSKLTADRDQTKTEVTIQLARDFLNKYPQDSEYRQSVQDMIEICYKDLITREINVIQSQINKYKYSRSTTALTGAHKRITYIKDMLLPHVKTEEPHVIQMELKLAQMSGKQDVIRTLEQQLQTKYPNYSTQVAQADKKWWHIF